MNNLLENIMDHPEMPENYKYWLRDLLVAELFRATNIKKVAVAVRSPREGDNRLFAFVEVTIEANKVEGSDNKELHLYQCRPFIDKGCTISFVEEGVYLLKKSYHLEK